MQTSQTAPALALCVVLVGLVLPACDVIAITQPCYDGNFRGGTVPSDPSTFTNPKGLDGGWSLITIDGQSIPATGYRLPPDPKKPLDPPKYLRYGVLSFNTDEAGFDNDCKDLLRSEGTAIADYGTKNIPTAGIDDIDRKAYSGRFHNNHETNAGFVGAGKYETPMTITTTAGRPTKITIRAEVDLFIAGITYTLVFQR